MSGISAPDPGEPVRTRVVAAATPAAGRPAAGAALPGDPCAEPAPQRSAAQHAARTALAGVLGLLGLYTLRDFLPALAWAVIFAIATWPLFRRAKRRWPPGRHNLLLPLLFTAGIALVFLVPLSLIALEATREAQGVLAWMQHARHTGVPVPNWVHKLPVAHEQATSWWQQHLADPDDASDLFDTIKSPSSFRMTRQLGTQVAHRATLFAFSLITLFFLFREGETVTERLLVASRRAFGRRGERVGRQMVASVHGTVDGLVMVGLGEGVLLGVAYAVAGAPHPTLFGLVTAIAAMIPFCAVLSIGLASCLVLAQGSTAAAIILFVVGMVIVFAADHFVRPVLIGGATKLPFLWVLLGILGGVEAWGLIGLFVGPAIMAALILLWREYTDPADEPPAVTR